MSGPWPTWPMDKPKHFLSAGHNYLKCCNAAFPASANDFRWSSLQSHREKQILTSPPVSPPHIWMLLQTMQCPRTHITPSVLNTTLSASSGIFQLRWLQIQKGAWPGKAPRLVVAEPGPESTLLSHFIFVTKHQAMGQRPPEAEE